MANGFPLMDVGRKLLLAEELLGFDDDFPESKRAFLKICPTGGAATLAIASITYDIIQTSTTADEVELQNLHELHRLCNGSEEVKEVGRLLHAAYCRASAYYKKGGSFLVPAAAGVTAAGDTAFFFVLPSPSMANSERGTSPPMLDLLFVTI